MSDLKTKSNSPLKKISKIILIILIASLLCGIISIAILPSLLSSQWGNEKIAQLINSQISGKMTFKKLQLSWLNEQSLEDVHLYDFKSQQIASLEKITADVPLWKLLLYSGRQGAYTLSGLNAQIEQEAYGQTNIQQALTHQDISKAVKNTKQSSLTISLQDVNASASLNDKKNNTIHLSGKTFQGNQQGSFNLDLSANDINKDQIFDHKHHLNTDQLSKIQIQAHIIDFPVSLLDEAIALYYPNYKGLLLDALGDTLNLHIEKSKDPEATDLNLQIATPLVKGTLTGLLKDDQVKDKVLVTLDGQVSRNNVPTKINLQGQFNKSQGIFEADLNIKQFNLEGFSIGDAQISDIKVHFTGSHLTDSQVSLTATVIPAKSNTTLQHWLGVENHVQLNAVLHPNKRLQLHLTVDMEKMSDQKNLASLIGPALHVDLHAQISDLEKLTGSFHLILNAKDLDAQGTFDIKNGLIVNQPSSPALIKFQLTPERFQAYRKIQLNSRSSNPEIVLMTPSQITLNINSISMPLKTNDTLNWLKANLVSHLTIDALNIKNKENGHQVLINNIEGTINSPELAKNISFSLKGQLNQEDRTSLPFSIQGHADNIFNSSGELNIDNLALLLDTKIQKFPVKLLGEFLSLDNENSHRISAVLGSAINADIHAEIDHLQGSIIANLNGSNGHVSLDAKINQGLLTLNKNFQTQITLTPEFGRVILEDIFPLASGVVDSDNPMTIKIDAAGFVLPIKNFNINAIQVRSATLELGKVRFRKDGKLGTILSLFNTSHSDLISVWFTPLYISMKNGTILFKRMDMLVMDTYPIATWGTVDLAADKVNMMIGLTGQALVKGFNIQGLGKDYVMQIPFKGTINNAAIDKKKATAKIAALVASTRGTEGLLIGTAIHIASGGLTEEKAPSPTTNPLPWSLGDDSSTTETSKPEKTQQMNDVEEKATNLLKKLLPF